MLRKLATIVILPLVAIAAFQGPSIARKNARVTNMSLDQYNHDPISLETSRRDVIQDAIKGSFLAVALVASGTPSPALAAGGDIAKQVKALQEKFKDSVNSNGAPEKHLPQVTLSSVNGKSDLTMVQVTVPHVMDPEKPHWILAIWLKEESSGDVAVAKVLPATEPAPPGLTCGVPKGARLTPYLYCNLHGLWKGDTFIA